MIKTKKRDAETADLVKKTALICMVSQKTVRRVIKGEQDNEKVLDTYMELKEGTKEVFDNLLLKEVNRVAPFK